MQFAVQYFHCAIVLLLEQIGQYPLHCFLEFTRVLPDRDERPFVDVHRVETKVVLCETVHACSSLISSRRVSIALLSPLPASLPSS